MTQGSPYGSQPNPYGNQNPYMPPQGQWGPPQGQWGPPAGYTPDVPGFCTVMFIVSLIFCLLRAAIVALGFIGMGVLKADDPAMKTAVLEIGTGLGMVLCGVPGNALLLFKNQVGFYLGWGLIAFTIANMFSGIATILFSGGNIGGGAPPPPGMENAQLVGMIIGGSISIIIRGSILVAYAAALLKFQSWHLQHGQQRA
jgi:hypothetical protein